MSDPTALLPVIRMDGLLVYAGAHEIGRAETVEELKRMAAALTTYRAEVERGALHEVTAALLMLFSDLVHHCPEASVAPSMAASVRQARHVIEKFGSGK